MITSDGFIYLLTPSCLIVDTLYDNVNGKKKEENTTCTVSSMNET